MKFAEFAKLSSVPLSNVYLFVCEDDFLVNESRAEWPRIWGGQWTVEKVSSREFEDVPFGKWLEDALTPSLFAQNRALLVAPAEKVTQKRYKDLEEFRNLQRSSLKIVLVSDSKKSVGAWAKVFPVVEIDSMKAAEVARWVVQRYGLQPEVARYLVDAAGSDLYLLHSEIEKLRTFAGERPVSIRDIDVLVLSSEQFAAWDLDDAILARDYKKAVRVLGAMLDEGAEPLPVLGRITRVWRSLFIGRALAGKASAKEVAAAAGIPQFKAVEFAERCRKFEWRQVVAGFRRLLEADRALKLSTPSPRRFLEVMLWKLMQQAER